MDAGDWSAPADAPILVGQPHCTRCDVTVTIYEYDSGVESLVLPAGSRFQPWEPLAHWRGVKVPITLGEGATELDWDVTSAYGHFLMWDDFFFKCATCEL